MSSGQPILAFIHIPKTAGTSFRRIIEENVGNLYTYKGLLEFLTKPLPSSTVIHGHMPYGIHRYTRKPVNYFTLLRDPVEQCLSYYYFSRCWQGQPDYQDATKYDLATFYRLRRHQNIQTRHLGGYVPPRISSGIPDLIFLSNAKRRLREKMRFGLVEKYEDSVRYLCDAFRWKNRPIVRSRHAVGRPLTAEVAPDVIADLRRYNKLDVQLYTYARDLFDHRLSVNDNLSAGNREFDEFS